MYVNSKVHQAARERASMRCMRLAIVSLGALDTFHISSGPHSENLPKLDHLLSYKKIYCHFLPSARYPLAIQKSIITPHIHNGQA
jgi:hypothetical protein